MMQDSSEREARSSSFPTDQIVEAMARAMWEARAAHFGEVVLPLESDERRDLFAAYARAALSALSSQGWAVVPVEPTEGMLEAMSDVLVPADVIMTDHEIMRDHWKAALSARPKVTQE